MKRIRRSLYIQIESHFHNCFDLIATRSVSESSINVVDESRKYPKGSGGGSIDLKDFPRAK